MKPPSILYLTAVFLLLFVTMLAAGYYYKFKSKTAAATNHPGIESKEAVKLKLLANQLAVINVEKTFNDELAFIIDMNIPSGNNRFFIYDLKRNEITASALVTHGRCNKTWLAGRQYSNVVGSGCTSPGKYKIGKSYYGRFGLAYKLHGLDSSNSNAYRRYVVLHAHDCVPENEIAPYPLCQSDGCPTVSPGFLKKLKKIIDGSSKPLLLSISE